MRKRTSITGLALIIPVFAFAGCASLAPAPVQVPQLKPEQHCLVYVADGAGDFRQTSQHISASAAGCKASLAVETFVWSHGTRRVLADQLDGDHIHQQGHRLAELVLDTRKAYPDVNICLMGHSAGSQVVLAAADELPPSSVERIVLLNPSVSADYDLRKALRAAYDGIDVHCSTKDYWYLGVVVGCISALQGKWVPAAGIEGFRPVIESPEDQVLYTRLHHFPWRPDLAKTGNDGGHYGGYQDGYVRKFILPRLTGSAVEGAAN